MEYKKEKKKKKKPLSRRKFTGLYYLYIKKKKDPPIAYAPRVKTVKPGGYTIFKNIRKNEYSRPAKSSIA